MGRASFLRPVRPRRCPLPACPPGIVADIPAGPIEFRLDLSPGLDTVWGCSIVSYRTLGRLSNKVLAGFAGISRSQ